jgi:hypothetical protein
LAINYIYLNFTDDMGREAKGKHRIFMAGQSTVLEKVSALL